MSCRTIVYKGMFFAPQLFDYYLDLADKRQAEVYMKYHNEVVDQGVAFWWINSQR